MTATMAEWEDKDWKEIVSYSFSPSEDDVVIEDGDETKIVEVVVKERGWFGKVYKAKMSYADAKRYRRDMDEIYAISIYDHWKGDNT